MSRKKVDPVPQRNLAMMLRYHIDCAVNEHAEVKHLPAIRAMVELNPTSSRSSHVRHNLGVERMRWLESRGITL